MGASTDCYIMYVICCRQQLEGMRSDLSAAQKRQKDLQGTVEAKEARASDIQANVRGLQDILQETQSELGTPLDSQLTTEERHQLRQLQEDIRQLQVAAHSCMPCLVLLLEDSGFKCANWTPQKLP